MHINPPQTSTHLDIFQSDSLQEWLVSYLFNCRSRNLSKGTCQFYEKKLGEFLKFLSDIAITKISQISAQNIRQFLIYLEERNHKPGGIHCYYRAVKSFLKWYESEAEPEGWRNPINKVKSPIVPLTPLDPVSIESIQRILETCKNGTIIAARDRASLLMLLDTGIRLAEFLGLNREDVNLMTGEVLIRSGKGRKPRTVYLGEKSRQALKRYIKMRTDHNPALWISQFDQRLTETGLRMMLRRRSHRAGIPDPSPHDFRRAFALERWRAGLDILVLAKLMGHTSLQVLNRYIKQSGEDLQTTARMTSPVDRNF